MMKRLEFHEWCRHQHDVECNQKYDGTLPYSFHLEMVLHNAIKYIYLIEDKSVHADILAACMGHDLIEDARVTYNDIVAHAGERVAELIFLCTEERGRNRKERKSDGFYEELSTSKYATFVKLCDIMANTAYSTLRGHSMLKKHKAEWPRVKEFLYTKEFDPIFEYIDKLHQL